MGHAIPIAYDLDGLLEAGENDLTFDLGQRLTGQGLEIPGHPDGHLRRALTTRGEERHDNER
jgi:hypothetical protein